MAFIRSYSHRAQLADIGDPFSLRMPRKLRKWQPGKQLAKVGPALMKLAPIAAGIAVPGIGGLVASALMQKLSTVSQRYGVPMETLQGFARAYGYDVGDPGPAKKRKGAASGTKAKAKAKATKRAAKAKTPGRFAGFGKGMAKRAGKMLGKGADFAGQMIQQGLSPEVVLQLLKGGGSSKAEIQQQVAEDMGLPAGLDLSGIVSGGRGKSGARVLGFGRSRRTMNPTNIKALRRSIRRLEGFQTVVKRVEKMLPRSVRRGASAPSRGRGHRHGCGCAVCKRG